MSKKPSPIQNRVKEHRLVKASELLANEKNYRRHPERQKRILTQNLQEIGHARSLTAYETPQGLRLIDGHLRKDIDPDAMLPVEILDVTEQEANVLLLTLDPLAGLAETDSKILEELLNATPTTGGLEAWLKEQAAAQLVPEATPQPPPMLRGECLIEISCAQVDLDDFRETLDDWARRKGVMVSIV